VDKTTLLRQEARECEIISALERDQARIDRLIAEEERRRNQIVERLNMEIKRLHGMQRVSS
jgi:16S rRNA C967 or C1407 C5-methylase (RsmB/RsmF family)